MGVVAVAMVGFLAVWVISTPPVLQATRLIAPGEEGPKVVPKELSFIA